MNRHDLRAGVTCIVLSLSIGCGGDFIVLPEPTGDSALTDTSPVVDSGVDSGVDETIAPIDTGSPGDTAPEVAECVAPKKTCGGKCVDPQSDDANCGDCGIACSAGLACVGGFCKCPSTKVICGSLCVDVSSDTAHCGSCDKSCASGQLCVSGTCACPTGKPDFCDGACVDRMSDPKNCGACGMSCGGGTCSAGSCVCGGGLTRCGGTCLDTSSDPANCGGCGKACPVPSKCSSGTCVAPKCRTTSALNVLFYGPTGGSVEQPYLPFGAVSTVASETKWRAMTTADFAKYDLIVIGDPSTYSSNFAAANETKATWGPAITGRMAVLGLDPGGHTTSTGAITLMKATFSWLAGGPTGGTSLYVTTDWASRALDFLSWFGAFSSTSAYSNSVTITNTTHPMMYGSTSASLSSWSTSVHSFITYPTGFTSIATAYDTGMTGSVAVVRDAACMP